MSIKDDALSLVSEQQSGKKGKDKKKKKGLGGLQGVVGGAIKKELDGKSKEIIQKTGMALTGHVTNSVEDIDMGIRAHQSNAILNAQVATGTKGLSELGPLQGANKVVGKVNKGVSDFFSSANDALMGKKKGEKDEEKAEETAENADKAEAQDPAAEAGAGDAGAADAGAGDAGAADAGAEEAAAEEAAQEQAEAAAEEAAEKSAEKGKGGKQGKKGGKGSGKGGSRNTKVAGKGSSSAGSAGTIPKLGDGAPTVGPLKGQGTGDNSVEVYSNSGASYQQENYSSLDQEVNSDAEKAVCDINAATPGVKDQPINDGSRDTERAAASQQMKAQNAANVNADGFDESTNYAQDGDKSAIDAQKKSVSSGGDENIPACTVNADTSVIDADAQEASQKYSEAQSSAEEIAACIDKDFPERGFDDLKTPKVEVELPEEVKTQPLPGEEEFVQLDDEAKAVFDYSEETQKAGKDMEAAVDEVNAAEAEREAESAKEIANYESAVEDEKNKAAQEEQKVISEKRAELDNEFASQKAQYNKELENCNAEQEQAINEARTEMANEEAKANKEIEKKQKEGEAAKKDAEKDEKEESGGGFFGFVKRTVKAGINMVKNAVNKVVSFVKNAICAVLDAFVAIASRINKNLGDKLKGIVNKFKDVLNKMANAFIEFTNKALDAINEAVDAIVDAVEAAITALKDGLVAILKAIVDVFVAVLKAALEIIQAALSFLADFFFIIIKAICEQLGVSTDFLDALHQSVKTIIANVIQFVVTIVKGFAQGFHQFLDNITDNLLVMLKNLINIWLGTCDLKLPEAFSMPCIIKFGLELIGIDVDSILKMMGLDDDYQRYVAGVKDQQALKKQGVEVTEDISVVDEIITTLKTEGVKGLWKYIKEDLGDIIGDITKEFAINLLIEGAKKGVAKLIEMAVPGAGLLVAIKAVWDLIQFVRSNFEAIKGLVKALYTVFASAANGETDVVANATEAVLCQAIPLVVDLLLRLAGINIGAQVQKVVMWLRNKVNKVLGVFTKPFKTMMAKMNKGARETGMKANETEWGKKLNTSTANQKANQFGEHLSGKLDQIKKQPMGHYNRTDSQGRAIGMTVTFDDVLKTAPGITSTLEGKKEGHLGLLSIYNAPEKQYFKDYNEYSKRKEMAALENGEEADIQSFSDYTYNSPNSSSARYAKNHQAWTESSSNQAYAKHYDKLMSSVDTNRDKAYKEYVKKGGKLSEDKWGSRYYDSHARNQMSFRDKNGDYKTETDQEKMVSGMFDKGQATYKDVVELFKESKGETPTSKLYADVKKDFGEENAGTPQRITAGRFTYVVDQKQDYARYCILLDGKQVYQTTNEGLAVKEFKSRMNSRQNRSFKLDYKKKMALKAENLKKSSLNGGGGHSGGGDGGGTR